MPYRYVEHTADAAFDAWGSTLEELFRSAADATLAVMLEDVEALAQSTAVHAAFEAESPEMLLFAFLGELVYRKDAERLLLRPGPLRFGRTQGGWTLEADLVGEEIDPSRHGLLTDVKAVTLHGFCVEQTADGWRARVLLDV